MAALDALFDVPEIRYIVTRHEQAHHLHGRRLRPQRAGARAWRWSCPASASTTRRPASPRPTPARRPCCCSPARSTAHGIGRDLGLLHDVHDQLDVVRPITKWAERVLRRRPGSPAGVHEAFRPDDHRSPAPDGDRDPAGDVRRARPTIALLGAGRPRQPVADRRRRSPKAAELLAGAATPADRGRRRRRARRRHAPR